MVMKCPVTLLVYLSLQIVWHSMLHPEDRFYGGEEKEAVWLYWALPGRNENRQSETGDCLLNPEFLGVAYPVVQNLERRC
jgi:hypothetical protein